MEVTVLGHGSLMSGRGLAFSGTLHIKEAGIVALKNCTRGFAKLSRYGDRFATDIEAQQFPLEGERLSPETTPTEEVETLALTVSLDDFLRLVKREGYSPEAMQRLADFAFIRKQSLAEYLWQLQTEATHDRVAYRRQLFQLTAYTSPHYIPHPVRLDDGAYAVIFLAPGFEGTGADDVVSVRQQTGIQKVMNITETWRCKPNDDQLSYFLSCLLGGAHGVNVRDLLAAIDEERSLAALVRTRLIPELQREAERFIAGTNLPELLYQRAFGEMQERLVRSGLQTFLGPTSTEIQY